MRVVHLISGLLSVSVACAPALAQVGSRASYVAGKDGWTSDVVGGGLVTLRTRVAPRGGVEPGEQGGTLLAICAPHEDRLIFDPSVGSAIRTVEPAGTGIAYLFPLSPAKQAEGPTLSGTVKYFAGGSFELSDLPTGGRNTVRQLMSQVATGPGRFRFQLGTTSVQGGFERDRLVTFEFAVSKADQAAFARFESACKLIASHKS